MNPKAPRVSFEFFPPATEEMAATLWRSVERLAPLSPEFVSVTYGADGSTRERTHRIVERIARDTGLSCVPHLTCVGAPRCDVQEIARTYWESGVRHIVALRGDPAKGSGRYEPHPINAVAEHDLNDSDCDGRSDEDVQVHPRRLLELVEIHGK